MSKDSSADIPYVAVWMVTYNHEKYIHEAIEGVLNQKTSFPVKLFVGEDCSKDSTKDICLGYAAKYPDRVVVISTKQNNVKHNIDNVWKLCITSGAKYIAMCDGDDYWTDPFKLQKQVDFLDAHPDFSMSFTNIEVINEAGVKQPDYLPRLPKDEFTIADIIMAETGFILTSTLVFRNILPYPLPSFYMNTSIGDAALYMLLGDKGKAKFLDEKASVYRHHAGGVSKSEQYIQNEYQRIYTLFEGANKYFEYKYNDLFRERLLQVSKTILMYGARNKTGFEKIKHATGSFKKYLKYAERKNPKEAFYYLTVLFFPSVLKLKDKK